MAPFDYHVGSADSTLTIDVPVGFRTDFASIPRLLWPLLPPTGSYGKAAVIHDALYQTGTFTRATADAILLEAMVTLHVPLWSCLLVYLGVRLGGWLAWRAHRHNDPPVVPPAASVHL